MRLTSRTASRAAVVLLSLLPVLLLGEVVDKLGDQDEVVGVSAEIVGKRISGAVKSGTSTRPRVR